VNIVIGAMILKDQFSLTEDELLESICCDIRFQYALHTTHLKDQPVSDRTLSRFRERLYNYERETGIDLLKEEMQALSERFAQVMNIDGNIKRMDSLMVASHSKNMSRLEIMYTVVCNSVKLLKRNGLSDLIPQELAHYLVKDDVNQVIYHSKSEDMSSKLKKVTDEAIIVKGIFDDNDLRECLEFQLLIRVLDEQTVTDENGQVSLRSKNEIKSTSLQNPSDPDATYRKKAGKGHKGYVGNIVETVGESGDSLITDIQFEQNIYSDAKFCKDYLKAHDISEGTEILITDGAYNSIKNQELANSKNVELVCTAMTSKQPEGIFKNFKLNHEGTAVTKCPMGYAPVKSTYNPKTGNCRTQFKKSCCKDCPHRNECGCKEQRKTWVVNVSASKIARAQYAEKMTTEKYRKLSGIRNAIEGVPSVMRRKYRVDEIPVFGYLKTKMFFTIKVIAYNCGKLRRYLKRHRAFCA